MKTKSTPSPKPKTGVRQKNLLLFANNSEQENALLEITNDGLFMKEMMKIQISKKERMKILKTMKSFKKSLQ